MLRKYENNAWQDITQLRRHDGSAWVDCGFARKYENGAWSDVWTNGLKLKFHGVSLNTGGTYSYSVSDDRKQLTFDVDNQFLDFVVSKSSGFGTNITIQWTVDKTVSRYGCASIGWLDGSRSRLGGRSYDRVFYNYISSSGTYSSSISLSTNHTSLFLHLEADYNEYIRGTVRDIYINGEPVLFAV